jgi:cell fate regulator YaaT (PSP1 superfamily)
MDDDKHFLTEARYGALRHHSPFSTTLSGLKRGDCCIVRTDRGVEVGFVTSDLVPAPAEGKPASTEGKPGDGEDGTGEILRRFEAADEDRVAEIRKRADGADFEFCVDRIREHELPMRLVYVEHLFGGGRIIFYFVSDGRVDFRELVKDLARNFRTRIELRQIGVRDEAKILGDREFCGRELCCLAWMREIMPVTMRMAKNQKSTLDPNKISGRCSRLKCCLRFEDEVYSELRASLPRRGDIVSTERGDGRVVDIDTISATITVELEGRERLTLPYPHCKERSTLPHSDGCPAKEGGCCEP